MLKRSLFLISFFIVMYEISGTHGDSVLSNLLLKRVALIVAAKIFSRIELLAPEPARSVMSVVSMLFLETLSANLESDGNMKSFNATVDKMNENLGQLAAQLTHLKISVDEVFKEIRFQTLMEYQTDLKAEVDHFQQIVLGYGNDKDTLRGELVKFIDSYKSKNIENKILNYLNEASSTAKSFASTLVEFAKRNRDNKRNRLKSSPNKLVHDFYAAIMLKIFESNEFLLNCYSLINQLKSGKQMKNFYFLC